MLSVANFPILLLLIVQISHALNTTTVTPYANSTVPSSSSTSSTNGVGDLIASGLGMQNPDSSSMVTSGRKSSGTSSSRVLSSSPSNSIVMSSSRGISNMTTSESRALQSLSNGTTSSPRPTSTGIIGNLTIAPSAARCLAKLLSYSSVSQSWQIATDNLVPTIILPGSSSFLVYWSSTSQTAYVTLCDNVPRGLGTPVTFESTLTSFVHWTTTSTEYLPGSNPATHPDCTIDPSDCAILKSSWASRVSASPAVPSTSSLDCTTTYSSNGLTCDPSACVIGANYAVGQTAGVRLLYWPVTRIGNLCNGTTTLTGTQTGQGPNTYANPAVIGNLTITSPTVAISFAELTRTDKCGPTVRNHIVLMNPQDVNSQRGARAEEMFLPFDYADLNTKCFSSANATGCYTDVPSAAYFGQPSCGVGAAERSGPNAWCPQTIYNNYAPQIQLPAALSSVEPSWGTICWPNELGGWDPPIALSTESVLVAQNPTTAMTTTKHDSPTPQPQSRPTSTPSKTSGGDRVGDPKTTSANSQLLPGSQELDPGSSLASNVGIASQSTLGPNAGSNPDPNSDSGSQTIGIVGGQSVAADPSNANNAIIGGHTFTPGQQTTIDGVPVSVGNGGLVVGGSSTIVPATSGQTSPNTIAVIGSVPVFAGLSTANAVVVAGHTLSDGQSTVIDNTPVAVSGGNVVIGGGNGNSPVSTVAIPTSAPSSLGSGSIIGGSPVIVKSGHVIVGGSTLSASQQTTIDGTLISAGSNQVEIGSSTIAFGLSPADSGYTTQIGGETVVISLSHIMVGGYTLSTGQKTTVDGTVISAGLTQAVIGSSTIAIPTTSSIDPPYSTNISGEPIVITSGHIVVAGSTLSAGQRTTIDGTIISAGSTQAVIGSSTIPMTPADSSSSGAGFTQTVTTGFTQTVTTGTTRTVTSAALSLTCLRYHWVLTFVIMCTMSRAL